KGTGLGLSMVHGFAAQSGGRFALESQPGAGTTAEIWLPVAAAVRELRAPQMPAPRQPVSSPALTILAVDDDALVLMGTTAILEDLGHRVLEASSGTKALEILEDERVDVVVTDQAMPHMTGLQLIARIHERHPAMPVILASGYADLPASAERDVQRLSKPFSERQLAEAIAASLATAKASNVTFLSKERMRRDIL
ncbi:response regulator, partial [Jiella sonneratiae]